LSDRLDTCVDTISTISDNIQQLVGKRDSLTNNIKRLQKESEKNESKLNIVMKAKILLEFFVKSTEVQVREYIEPTITEALNFIFNQNLYFHIVFANRRGQVEIDFIILPNTKKEEEYQKYILDIEKYEKELDEIVVNYKNIVFNYGGAVQEVLGLVLRLLLTELLQIKGPIILDEPTSATHEEYAIRVGIFIKSLSERFHRQIIYVTHSQAMASVANKIYNVTNNDNISLAEEI
jgi:DNA repair exonuclease SbcCD ATPase subunit